MYVSVEQARKEIPLLSDKNDEYIKTNILRYMDVIRLHTNTVFELRKGFEQVDVQSKIIVSNKPLVKLVSLKYQADLLEEDYDYFVYKNRNLIVLEDTHRFKRQRKSISLEYTYGHEEVPPIVELTMIQLLKAHEDWVLNETFVHSENMDNEYSYTNNNRNFADIKDEILRNLEEYMEKRDVLEGNVNVYIV